MPTIREKKTQYCQHKSEVSKTKTTMFMACSFGFLDVCQWLVKHGSKKDIKKTTYDDVTPFEVSLNNNHLKVCQWLITEGALNTSKKDSNTLVKNIFLNPKREALMFYPYCINRHNNFMKLFNWSQQVINEYYSFKCYILPNSCSSQRRTNYKCFLWMLGVHGDSFRIIFTNLISEFLGIENEERFKNVKQFLKDARPLQNMTFKVSDKNLSPKNKKKRKR